MPKQQVCLVSKPFNAHESNYSMNNGRKLSWKRISLSTTEVVLSIVRIEYCIKLLHRVVPLK